MFGPVTGLTAFLGLYEPENLEKFLWKGNWIPGKYGNQYMIQLQDPAEMSHQFYDEWWSLIWI